MAGTAAQFAGRPCVPLPACIFLILALSVYGNAQIQEAKRVLLVEDQISALAVENVARAFEAQLTAKSPEPIEFFRESLDTFLIPEGNYQADVRRWYEHKYARRKLDLIVAIGPASHDFILKEHSRYFAGVPVVFCLDIKREQEAAMDDPDFTGVWLDFDPVLTVDAARQILPATKHVVVVAGNGVFDQLFIKEVKTKLQGYQGVDFTYLTDLDMSSLLKRVGSLSNDSVILYLTVTKDRADRHMFVAFTLPLLSASADVPVFGMIDALVGLGIVGGRLTGFLDSAPIAAELALRVLKGEKPAAIPSVTLANRDAFDWKQLQRWGVDVSRLPVGSAVLNRDPRIWQKYRRIILTVLGLLLLLTGLVIYLLVERRERLRAQRALERDVVERRKAEAALVTLSGRLINAQEEERSRIARELHDDFNQRLAVLAINLKRAARTISLAPEKAVVQINELCDSTSEIGSDIHKMSRRLHSATLDVLGLVEGIHGLCDDFAEQQGLHIEFLADNVPRSLSPEISLCLFRVTQEALSNVKKHSGAEEAVVQLHRSSDEIVLSIVDAGIGFDPGKASSTGGLGLRSMQERLRAVGGTVEIDSQKGGGTQILVRAPLSLAVAVSQS